MDRQLDKLLHERAALLGQLSSIEEAIINECVDHHREYIKIDWQRLNRDSERMGVLNV